MFRPDPSRDRLDHSVSAGKSITAREYFTTSLQLFENANIRRNLAKYGIVPEKESSFSYGWLQLAFRQCFGCFIQISCARPNPSKYRRGTYYVLKEIVFSFDSKKPHHVLEVSIVLEAKYSARIANTMRWCKPCNSGTPSKQLSYREQIYFSSSKH